MREVNNGARSIMLEFGVLHLRRIMYGGWIALFWVE